MNRKEEIYFILWGILAAFALQVLYDGWSSVAEGLVHIPRFYVGLVMILIFVGLLLLFRRQYKGEKPKKVKE